MRARPSRGAETLRLERLSRLTPSRGSALRAATAGELLHLDTKKLGRFRRAGIASVQEVRCTGATGRLRIPHVCVDDTAACYVEMLSTSVPRQHRSSGARRWLRSRAPCTMRDDRQWQRLRAEDFAARARARAASPPHRPIRREPTAKPNASSRRCCGNGRTLGLANLESAGRTTRTWPSAPCRAFALADRSHSGSGLRPRLLLQGPPPRPMEGRPERDAPDEARTSRHPAFPADPRRRARRRSRAARVARGPVRRADRRRDRRGPRGPAGTS